jgi:hypothetical protein
MDRELVPLASSQDQVTVFPSLTLLKCFYLLGSFFYVAVMELPFSVAERNSEFIFLSGKSTVK